MGGDTKANYVYKVESKFAINHKVSRYFYLPPLLILFGRWAS